MSSCSLKKFVLRKLRRKSLQRLIRLKLKRKARTKVLKVRLKRRNNSTSKIQETQEESPVFCYTTEMFRKTFIFFIGFVVCGGSFFVLPRGTEAQELVCNTPEEKAACQAQYDELQKEIVVQQQIIKDTQAKKGTLQGDVTTLNAQIKGAQAQINAKNITIKQLSAHIVTKNVVIGQLTDRTDRGKESLASILRQTQMIDDYSVVSVALG